MPGYATFSPNYLCAHQMDIEDLMPFNFAERAPHQTPADARKQRPQCDNPGSPKGIITLQPEALATARTEIRAYGGTGHPAGGAARSTL